MSVSRMRWSKQWALGLAAVIALSAVLAFAGPRLKSAAEVLGASAQSAQKSGADTAAALNADVVRYRAESAGLAPQAAARRWFELYDRARNLGPTPFSGDLDTFDPATTDAVGVRSMFASLPPPPAWQSLRAEATRRAAAAPDVESLGLRYLTELLSADRAAATRTLADIEQHVAQLPPAEREPAKLSVRAARSTLARLYGSVDERLEVLGESLRTGATYESLVIPDLVAMVGEQRATELLEGAVTSRMQLEVEGGDQTRALVQRIALANIDKMHVPQWNLVDTVDAAPLYEALDARFPSSKTADEESMDVHDYARQQATAYYFLASVKNGRQAEAQRALGELDNAYFSRDAFAALDRAGLNEPVFRFLDALLARRPELRAWNVYLEQAAKTGHSGDALALLDRLLARHDLPDFIVADLRLRRIAALLAADRVDPAAKEFRVLLAAPPARGQKDLASRLAAAIQVAQVGRLLGRKDLAELGIGFAQRASRLDAPEARAALAAQRQPLIAELRRQGRVEQAQDLAITALRTAPARGTGFEALYPRGDDVAVVALVELAGIYSAAGQHRDILELLDKSPLWGVDDVSSLLTYKDSLDVPFGAVVARALEGSGDRAGALRVARATVAALPNRDAAYEIVASLDPEAAAAFEQIYASDEFEERPLIWKAAVELRAGQIEAAERDVRRAIAVDPSDGEEGPNDRMRAYSLLAEILRRKGATQDADLFANAVAAIRLSEHADELYHAGLLERAFRTYRAGLDKFSDAYCIQSRLAVQLNKVGRRQEALEHYRRAYELMPGSFGRVESHCFGCENVFADPESQTIAERVFTDVIRKSPGKAQAHYLLAYLREQQGNFPAAVQPLRVAVGIDSRYLNAWKRLDEIADKTYLEAGERDIARLKLLELDPLQRHSSYDLDEIGQLEALWNGVERARQVSEQVAAPRAGVRPLAASAAVRHAALEALPPQMRAQAERMQEYMGGVAGAAKTPREVLAGHVLVTGAQQVMGDHSLPDYLR